MNDEKPMHKKEKLASRSGWKCYYCGELLPDELEDFHAEHILPKSQGGKDKDNVIVSCADCNAFKGPLDQEGFRKKIYQALDKTIQGRIIKKFYKLEPKYISFFYEEYDLLTDAEKSKLLIRNNINRDNASQV